MFLILSFVSLWRELSVGAGPGSLVDLGRVRALFSFSFLAVPVPCLLAAAAPYGASVSHPAVDSPSHRL